MLNTQKPMMTDTPYPTLKEAVWYWLTLGFMSFGGPAGQIAMMHDDLVEQKCWISNKRFLHALNFCMVLPGPEAQQLAIYLGWLLHRTKGGIIAGLLFITPAFFILVALAYVYLVFGQKPIIADVFNTIKPAVIAIVFFAAWRMGKRALTNTFFIGIASIAFFAITVFKVAFPWVMVTLALLGLIALRIKPSLFDSANDSEHHLVQARKSDIQTSGSALVDADQNTQALNIKSKTYYVIDDDTPLPMYARFNKWYFFTLLLVGLALWVGVMLLLVMLVGWQGMYTQMAWFFTKAALLTFGGA
jgi:chromate transporter